MINFDKLFLFNIVSLLIINHKFKSSFNPIFDSNSPFTLSKINIYFNNNCIPTLTTNSIYILKLILVSFNI